LETLSVFMIKQPREYKLCDQHRPFVISADLAVQRRGEEDFLENPSEWEKEENRNLKRSRRFLVEYMVHKRYTLERRQWYYHRWGRYLFDSVSPHYFVLTDVYVPVLDMEMSDEYERFESDGKNDVPDVDYVFLNKMSFGIADTDNVWAVREKLHGVRIDVSGGKIHCLGMVGPCETGLADQYEWTRDGLFSIYPYAVPSHSLGPNVKAMDHRWQKPDLDLLSAYEEGAIFLTPDGEMRMRNNPSTEIFLEGIMWEVALDDMSNPVRIRPRYGKAPGNIKQLERFPGLNVIDEVSVSYDIELRTEGPFLGSCTRTLTALTLDSGYRIDPRGVGMGEFKFLHVSQGLTPMASRVTKVKHTDLYHWFADGEHNAGPFISGMGSHHTGAKVFILDPNETYVVKDGLKDYDYLGGTVEYGESTRDALIREAREEINLELDPDLLLFMGISTGEEEKNVRGEPMFWHTYMYMYHIPTKPSLGFRDEGHWCTRISPLQQKDLPGCYFKFQPWYSRLKKFVMDKSSGKPWDYYKQRASLHKGTWLYNAVRQVVVSTKDYIVDYFMVWIRGLSDHYPILGLRTFLRHLPMMSVSFEGQSVCSHSNKCGCILRVRSPYFGYALSLDDLENEAMHFVEFLFWACGEVDGKWCCNLGMPQNQVARLRLHEYDVVNGRHIYFTWDQLRKNFPFFNSCRGVNSSSELGPKNRGWALGDVVHQSIEKKFYSEKGKLIRLVS